MNYAEKIIERLNSFLVSINRPPVTMEQIVFALDSNVSFKGKAGERMTIEREYLMQPPSFEDLIAPIFRAGASWIHADLIPLRGHTVPFVVTIDLGELIGNPQPSINVTCEPDQFVDVVD